MTLLGAMLEKQAALLGSKEKETHTSLVHHPLVQALGYGALAAEGVHELAHRAPEWLGARVGGPLEAAAKSRLGTAAGVGAIGGSAAFLGAEGVSALKDYLAKRRAKAPKEKTSADVFLDEIGKVAVFPKIPPISRTSKAISKALKSILLPKHKMAKEVGEAVASEISRKRKRKKGE